VWYTFNKKETSPKGPPSVKSDKVLHVKNNESDWEESESFNVEDFKLKLK